VIKQEDAKETFFWFWTSLNILCNLAKFQENENHCGFLRAFL